MAVAEHTVCEEAPRVFIPVEKVKEKESSCRGAGGRQSEAFSWQCLEVRGGQLQGRVPLAWVVLRAELLPAGSKRRS